MDKAIKPTVYIIQWCSVFASHWVKAVEFESVIAVWSSVYALKIAHAQLVVYCIYATTVFGNERAAFTQLTYPTSVVKTNKEKLIEYRFV